MLAALPLILETLQFLVQAIPAGISVEQTVAKAVSIGTGTPTQNDLLAYKAYLAAEWSALQAKTAELDKD